MNDLYMRLGRAIAMKCKPGFARAALLGSMEDNGLSAVQLTYQMDDGREWEPELDDEDREDLRAALAEVREAQEKEDGKVWKTCTVTLTRGGGFEMDVGY